MKPLEAICRYWNELYPNPTTELNYRNPFELLVAVLLSAQTTDKAVNQVTPLVFERYPTSLELAKANYDELSLLLSRLGLYKTKAKHLILMAQRLQDVYQGIIPTSLEALMTLPGVGRKTASVVLVQAFDIPAFPVDTHVARIAKRLGFAKEKDSVLVIEERLRRLFPPADYHLRHHQMILFGRYHCKALRPNCLNCQIQHLCLYKKEAK